MADDHDDLLCDEDIDSITAVASQGFAAGELANGIGGPSSNGHVANGFVDDDSLLGFEALNDDNVGEMVENQVHFFPREDYLWRLISDDLYETRRRECLDWMSQVQTHFNIGSVTFVLAVNYFDRFLSISDITIECDPMFQLVAIASLVLAAKVDGATLPDRLDELKRVGNPRYVFEERCILIMERTMLGELNWRLNAFIPTFFIGYFLRKINYGGQPSENSISRSVEVIVRLTYDNNFLEFRHSEIAAAVVLFVSEETRAVDIDAAIARFIHVGKDPVVRCLAMIRNLGPRAAAAVNGGPAPAAAAAASSRDRMSNGHLPNGYPDQRRRRD